MSRNDQSARRNCLCVIYLTALTILNTFRFYTTAQPALHPFSIPHLRIFKVFLIYSRNFPVFSITQSYAPNLCKIYTKIVVLEITSSRMLEFTQRLYKTTRVVTTCTYFLASENDLILTIFDLGATCRVCIH